MSSIFSAVDIDLIEPSKENIQPLRGGRDPHALVQAIQLQEQPNNKKLHESLASERAKFEAAILNYTGSNPLTPWLDYIAWTIKSHSSLTSSSAHLLPLLEKCTRTFLSSPDKYFNDPRYVSVWLMYADNCPNPASIFDFMSARQIGDECSIRFVRQSAWWESRGNFKQAEFILQQAIDKKTKPLNTATIAMKNLTARNANRIEKNFELMKLQEIDPLSQQVQSAIFDQPTRRALTQLGDKENGDETTGELSRQIHSNNATSRQNIHQTFRQTSTSMASTGNARFQIFNDDRNTSPDGDHSNSATNSGASVWHQLDSQKFANKENILTVTTWNTPLRMGECEKNSPQSEISIFVDDHCRKKLENEKLAAEKKFESEKKFEIDRSEKLAAIRAARLAAPSKPSNAAKLTEDPLRHINKILEKQKKSSEQKTTIRTEVTNSTTTPAPAQSSQPIRASLTATTRSISSQSSTRSSSSQSQLSSRPSLPSQTRVNPPVQQSQVSNFVFNDFE